MFAIISTALIIKLTLLPAMIGLLSLAGRRWGPTVAGCLVGLPLTSGPVILFLALEQGAPFAARAAQGTLLALISLAAFCVVYARMSRRAAWFPCLTAGSAMYLASTFVLERLTIPLPAAFLAAVLILAVALYLLPDDFARVVASHPPAWEIPVRMLTSAAIVIALTAAAHSLGPRLSGLLTPFPVAASILAGFTHHFEGAAAAVRLLRGLLAGLFSFALCFLIIALTLESWGLTWSFSIALLAAVAVQGASLWVLASRARNG